MTSQPLTEPQTMTLSLDANILYEEARSVRGLWKSETEETIRLFGGEVFESDSSGSGRSDDPSIKPFFALEGDLAIRKVLHLDSAAAPAAQLGFIAIEDGENQTSLKILINGHEILRPPSSQAAPDARQYRELAWSRWYYVALPPGCLQAGPNEIVISAAGGGTGWQMMVADYRDFPKGAVDPVVLPSDSQLSRDGGVTWSPERGEYVVRLLMDRFRAEGELITHVVDAAGQQDDVVRSERVIESLTINWAGETPPNTDLSLSLRSSTQPSADADDWSPWQPLTRGVENTDLRGRYVQLRVLWATSDPGVSPTLGRVTLQAQVTSTPERAPRVAGARNARILHSSWDMPHEDPKTQLLQQLRRECELDAVVAGAQTEFELISALHRWAYHIPLGDCTHFPWNVLDWIDLRRDDECRIELNAYSQRRRDKMCLYPNVVLVAALQSFGVPARHLNFHSEGMTGHEICEVWSNDHGKWIHLDATRDYYFFDRRTLAPLDTLEIHQVLVERLDKVETWEDPYLYRQDLEALVADLPISFWDGDYEHGVNDGDHGALFLFRSFSHFRIIPRFDVFSNPRPLPVSQGTEVWSWNGYLNWADDRVPPLAHFSHHTNRRADIYPTLNQTRFEAVSREDGRQLQMRMETSTPDFACYEVSIDQGAWQPSPDEWLWPLHDGMNTARMRSRNRSGRPGVISALAIVA